ncbi:hypothetical protein [Oceanimonas doudoroffii]|uniref:hypothetical protein n=1 Tax=Oceanimonas doudoroffii TaxID=84158 RepID=UPI001140587C|nr:hypothetical protein [Oceanimonas doudoroffii]
MDEILNALTNSSVWAGVILTFLLKAVFKRTPQVLKGFSRGLKLRHIRKIKRLRHNQDAVTYHSIKAHAYFLLFFGCTAFFLMLVSMGPLVPLLKLPQWVFFIAFSPVLFIEIMWLNQNSLAQSLIEHRGKLRVTRRSIMCPVVQGTDLRSDAASAH